MWQDEGRQSTESSAQGTERTVLVCSPHSGGLSLRSSLLRQTCRESPCRALHCTVQPQQLEDGWSKILASPIANTLGALGIPSCLRKQIVIVLPLKVVSFVW